jgi:hypothetical protein
MPVTRHPPHRSRRAALPHRAPASGRNASALRGIRMHDMGLWKPLGSASIPPLPGHALALTAPSYDATPGAESTCPEDPQPAHVARAPRGPLGPSDTTGEPGPALRAGPVPTLSPSLLDLLEWLASPCGDGPAPPRALAARGWAAPGRHAADVAGLWWPWATPLASCAGPTPTRTAARLLRVPCPAAPLAALPQVAQALRGGVFVLESRHCNLGERNGSATGEVASPLLRVSPWQCLTTPRIVGSPSPAHPTVRSGFPSPAVRPSSSHTMRRLRHGLEPAAANVDEPHRLPLAVRTAFPAATPACASLGQVPAQAPVDDTLPPSEGLAGVGVTAGVDPPHHHRLHHLHALLRADRRSSRRPILQAVPHLLLGGLGGEPVDGLLAAPGTLAFHKVEPDDIEAIGHPCHARLVAVAGSIHPRGDALTDGEPRLRAAAAYQDGLLGGAVEGRTALCRRASTRPQVSHESQVHVTGQRRARCALRPPALRRDHLSLAVRPDRERLLDQVTQTAIRAPLRAQPPPLTVWATREGCLAITLHAAPGAVLQVLAPRPGRLLRLPLGPGAVGAVLQIGLTARLQDERQRRLHHALCHGRDAERSRPAFGRGNLDHPHGCALGLWLAPGLVPCVSPLRFGPCVANPLDRHAIHPRRSLVGLALPPGLPEDVRSPDLGIPTVQPFLLVLVGGAV